MFHSLRLKTRLVLSFSAVVVLLLLVAILGGYELARMKEQADFIGGPVLEGVTFSRAAHVATLELRREVLNHVIGDEATKDKEEQRIKVSEGDFRQAMKDYEVGIFENEERKIFQRAMERFEAMQRLTGPILQASRDHDLERVNTLLGDQHKTVRDALYLDLEALVKINLDAASSAKASTEATYSSALWILTSLSLLGLLAAAAIGTLLTRSVIRRLGGDPADAANVVRKIADGDLDVEVRCDPRQPSLLRDMAGMRDRLQSFYQAQLEIGRQHQAGAIDYRLDPQQFPGAFGKMAESVNALAEDHIAVQNQVVNLMERYAVGDLSQDMARLPGKKAAITAAMDTTKRNLANINQTIEQLVQSAARGDFSGRGDVSQYQFAFAEMVGGLNRLMDTANRGLSDVGRVLQALAVGDLTQKVEAQYQGAFADLANNTNATVDSIAEIVTRISNAVETINTASGEIATGNSDLSTRTESQAASLEETASSMEELTATVRQNAENARNAEQVSDEARLGAQRGGAVVGEVIKTMQLITESSRKIGDIIGVIDGIAFQTNILALNAAVEAARAGDQGRGFAVVASEVRSLAQRSAEAAKEIKSLIDSSTRTVDSGAKLVNTAGEEIQTLVQSVARVTEIMKDISAASEEQRSGIEQVNETVIQLDQATQQNAALVEEATAAARSLEEQANGLAEAVGSFRLSATVGREPRRLINEALPQDNAIRLRAPSKSNGQSHGQGNGRSAAKDGPRAATSRPTLPKAVLSQARDHELEWAEF